MRFQPSDQGTEKPPCGSHLRLRMRWVLGRRLGDPRWPLRSPGV